MKNFIALFAFIVFCSSLTAQCFEDRHSRALNDGWLSCEESESPNELRGSGHWIQYDFGHVYNLGQSHIWNSSHPDFLTSGISEMYIDYSLDGVTWQEWGIFSLPASNGTGFYEGTEGPDFNGLNARAILITAISNHGGSCFGLSEIRINTEGLISSLDEVELEVSMDVFPNPASDYTTVIASYEDAKELPLHVYNELGSLIFEASISSSQELIINTSDWPAGQYIISSRQGIQFSQKNLTIVR